MKDLIIQMTLQTAKNILVPALKEYAAKTPGKLDDVVVNAIAGILEDPLLVQILQQKA